MKSASPAARPGCLREVCSSRYLCHHAIKVESTPVLPPGRGPHGSVMSPAVAESVHASPLISTTDFLLSRVLLSRSSTAGLCFKPSISFLSGLHFLPYEFLLLVTTLRFVPIRLVCLTEIPEVRICPMPDQSFLCIVYLPTRSSPMPDALPLDASTSQLTALSIETFVLGLPVDLCRGFPMAQSSGPLLVGRWRSWKRRTCGLDRQAGHPLKEMERKVKGQGGSKKGTRMGREVAI